VPLWLIITGLGITQIIGWGTVFFIIGTLSPDIAASTGWSQTLIFGAFTASLLVGAVVAKPCGRLIDTYGGRWLVPLGSVLLALGCAITGFRRRKPGARSRR
jgi:nitrate/nitrite transporter NarK